MKNKTTALLLSIFLGSLGIDRFYLGYTGMGILKLLTGGCFGILSLIDIVRIATGSLAPADGSRYEDVPDKKAEAYDNLLKISQLRENGTITEEEFEKLKNDCMNGVPVLQGKSDAVPEPTEPRKRFACKSCGAKQTGWYQKCPVCNAEGQMYRGTNEEIAAWNAE